MICMAVLWIVFLLLPKDGFVHIKSDNLKSIDLETEEITMKLHSYRIDMRSYGYTTFEFSNSNIQVENQYLFDKPENFVLVINGNTLFSLYRNDVDSLYNMPLNENELPLSVSMFKNQAGQNSFLNLSSDYSWVSLTAADNARTHVWFQDCDSITMGWGRLAPSHGGTEVSLSVIHNGRFIHIATGDGNLPKLKITSSYSCSAIIEKSTILDMDFQCDYFDIVVDRVAEANIISDGELNFNHTANSMTMLLTNNYLHLKGMNLNHSSKNKYAEVMTGHIIGDVDISRLTLYGRVSEAYISGYDVFPTFKGWLYSNLYLLATAFITAIFGGISIKRLRQ